MPRVSSAPLLKLRNLLDKLRSDGFAKTVRLYGYRAHEKFRDVHVRSLQCHTCVIARWLMSCVRSQEVVT